MKKNNGLNGAFTANSGFHERLPCSVRVRPAEREVIFVTNPNKSASVKTDFKGRSPLGRGPKKT